MIKVSRIEHVATLVEYNTDFNIDRFVQMIESENPGGYACGHGAASWYHAPAGDTHCTTTFNPYASGDPSTPGTWSNPRTLNRDGWVATGEYRGIRGEWHLMRHPTTQTRAPYER